MAKTTKKSRKAPGKSKRAQAADDRVAPDSPDYPGYRLHFAGKRQPAEPCEGPHTEFMTLGEPEVDIKVTVEHLGAFGNPKRPNLRITLTRA